MYLIADLSNLWNFIESINIKFCTIYANFLFCNLEPSNIGNLAFELESLEYKIQGMDSGIHSVEFIFQYYLTWIQI